MKMMRSILLRPDRRVTGLAAMLAVGGMLPAVKSAAAPATNVLSSIRFATNAFPPVLSLAIRCTNAVLKAGDEISIEFRVTNRGSNDYAFNDRDYDRSGRMGEYWLAAANAAGQIVPDPRTLGPKFWISGGISDPRTLRPGE